MILYFSGTGNSKYVAMRMNQVLQDECMDLFKKLKNHDTSKLHSERAYVVVSPTYGWQLPHLVNDWLKDVELNGNHKIYFVLTCGSDIANASKHLQQLCKEMNLQYGGCAEIIMPENYIALFDAPEKEEAIEMIEKADGTIDEIAMLIQSNQILPEKKIHFSDKIKSSVVNTMFYPLFVHAKKFRVLDSCVGCTICEQVCVMNNIQIKNGKPVWKDHCTHCMACICKCPKSAIEYGMASVGKPRYQCPK